MSQGKFLKLNDVEAYKQSFHLSNYVWAIVLKWDYFAKKTVGEQLVRSCDGMSANIAEGFGRYHKKDKIKFYRYSQGSQKETQGWVAKAKVRSLISEEEYQHIFQAIEKIRPNLYQLINFTNEKLKI